MALRQACLLGLATLAPVALGCSVILDYDDVVGDGGSGAGAECASTCGAPGCGSCPDASPVVVSSAKGAYRIDAYEVTNAGYRAWLETHPRLAGQRAECAGWNESYEPGIVSQETLDALEAAGLVLEAGEPCSSALGSGDERPVICIDWCDASAYCAWANKHLCGRIGGGTVNAEGAAYADADESEWDRACSDAGVQAFPYGNDYEAGWCNDLNSKPEAVGSFAQCEGGVSKLFDMSGNVSEWEDACTSYLETAPMAQNCLRRGGAFWNEQGALGCASPASHTFRGMPANSIGFRCCASD